MLLLTMIIVMMIMMTMAFMNDETDDDNHDDVYEMMMMLVWLRLCRIRVGARHDDQSVRQATAASRQDLVCQVRCASHDRSQSAAGC